MTDHESRQDKLGEHIARLVEKQPHPPRHVSPQDTLLVALALKINLILLGFSALGFALGVVLLTVSPGASRSLTISTNARAAPVCFLASLFLLLVVATITTRWRNTIRFGILGEAEVLSVRYSKTFYPGTFDAAQNGLAVGRWRRPRMGRVTEQPFSVDRPWARDLRPGSRIEVLMYDGRWPMLLCVRLLDGTRTGSRQPSAPP